jgi:hypothetical protein
MIVRVFDGDNEIYSYDADQQRCLAIPLNDDRDTSIEIARALDRAAELIAGPNRDGWWGL